MKRHFFLLIIILSVTVTSSHATDYVMFTPLDTAALPKIENKDRGLSIIQTALASDMLWENNRRILVKTNFAPKTMIKIMKTLYKTTNKHMQSISCAYWSQTPQGDSLLVSGKIYLPKNRALKGIVIANHYTIATDMEAPSNLFQMDCIYAIKGYAVIMPDYVGYGASRDQIHPYLHWRSAAQTAVDLLNSMPAVLDYYGYTYPHDVVITGYSQGGAVALGVARMMEEMLLQRSDTSNLSVDSCSLPWTIRKLYAGAGPYDPAATYEYCVAADSIGIPGAVPMIVMGLNDAYDLGFQLEDFFLEPLLSHYDEWVASKEYTVGQIGEMMGSMRMSVLMNPKVLDRSHPLTQLLYNALQANSNVGYDLQAPAYFLHSLDDGVVPFVNSHNLRENMPDNSLIEYDFDHYGSHVEGALPFIQKVYQEL